jgi:sugar phosphate isomerase/epimerase
MWAAHPDNASDAAWSDMRTELESALEQAAQHKVEIGIEPEPGNVIADAGLARRILSELKDPHLGIVLDAANLVSAHLGEQADIMDRAADLLGGDIILVHAKDIDATGKVVAAGAGAVDLRRFLRLLRKNDYDGAVIAHGFEHRDTKASARFLHSLLRDGE